MTEVFDLLPTPYTATALWDPTIDPPTPVERALLLPMAKMRAEALRTASLRVAAPDAVRAARVVAQRALRSSMAPYFAAALEPVRRFTVADQVRTVDHARGIAAATAEFDMTLWDALGSDSLSSLQSDALLREFRSRHFASRVAAASALLVLVALRKVPS